ncbi:MAG: cytochrome ubiquinol oxidase subunit I [Chlamydiales bacterium]
MDVVFLSRIQFAMKIAFHYLYPPLSIGLGLILVVMESVYIKTKNPKYKQVLKFWTKVFALTFALGVATGIVMAFSFGNNWARYSRFVGDVFGSALAAEGIFAFFLEAGFLGVLLFGWDKVSTKIHFLATICVAAGAHFSAVWITVANSWMQTPKGFTIVGEGKQARAVITNYWDMVFNPSSMDRLCHVILGCWLTGAFLVISISAYYLLRKRHTFFAQFSMKIGLIVAGCSLILQLISGDSSARVVAKHQPEKLAAAEGLYKTEESTPLSLVGWASDKNQKVYAIKIPGFLSFLVHRNFRTPVQGLDAFPKDDLPPVRFVFQLYHLMLMTWGAMTFLTLCALYYWKKGRLHSTPWILKGLIVSIAFPYIGNQAGWWTAEVGRQPWIVYKLLRTSDGASRLISAGQVLTSIILFGFIYILLFSLFLYLLNHKIQYGPEEHKDSEPVYRDNLNYRKES